MSELKSFRPSDRRPQSPQDSAHSESSIQTTVKHLQFQSLDRGFGIDTTSLIERSQRVHSHHRRRQQQTPEDSVILSASSGLENLSRSVALSRRQKIQNNEHPQKKYVAASISAENPISQPAQIQTVPLSAKPVTAPLAQSVAAPQVSESKTKITSARMFCSFLADICIPASLFVSLYFTQTIWQTGWNRTLSQFALRSQTWANIEGFFQLFPWFPTLILVVGLTFFTQFFCALLGRNSFGRSLCGIIIDNKGSLSASFFVALFEAITFGGLATCPMLLIMPNRLPLFPWIRFKYLR